MKLPRGINNRIRVIIALHQREHAFIRVAVRFQFVQLPVDLWQSKHETDKLPRAVFHIPRGVLVKGKGAR